MTVKEFLENEKIYEYSILSASEVRIIDPRRWERLFGGGVPLTVVPFLIPYKTAWDGESNISVYAHARDYHYYFVSLIERAKAVFGDGVVAACDTSPVDEVALARDSGLGSFGKNGLMINERYGTYAFVAELFFSLPEDDPVFRGIEKRHEGQLCLGCDACVRACPTGAIQDKTRCISYINQKKKIDDGEEALIRASGSVWGCDICQSVCPMNKSADETEIPFFKEERHPYLTRELVDEVERTGEFEKRAYAWRGVEVVRRNLRICQEKK